MKNIKKKHRRNDDDVLLLRVYVRAVAGYVDDTSPIKETLARSVAARVCGKVKETKIDDLIEYALKKTRPVNRASLRKEKIRIVAADLLTEEGRPS